MCLRYGAVGCWGCHGTCVVDKVGILAPALTFFILLYVGKVFLLAYNRPFPYFRSAITNRAGPKACGTVRKNSLPPDNHVLLGFLMYLHRDSWRWHRNFFCPC